MVVCNKSTLLSTGMTAIDTWNSCYYDWRKGKGLVLGLPVRVLSGSVLGRRSETIIGPRLRPVRQSAELRQTTC